MTYFKKGLFTLLLSLLFSAVHAKDVYLSSAGVDTNDGLTQESSVVTFSRAYEITSAEDVIHVSGIIDLSSDPGITTLPKAGFVLTKNISIQGTSKTTDGFDGKSLTRLFQVNEDAHLSLSNLVLKNGKYGATGANGGAFFVNGGSLSCDNLIFDSNTSFDSNSTGGAVMVSATTGLSFNHCLFSNNSGKGGALYIADTGHPDVTTTIENSSFISNTSLGTGGSAIFLQLYNTSVHNTIYLTNSTFAKNNSPASSGGTISLYRSSGTPGEGTTVTITNCTVTENSTYGTAGNCAGIRVNTAFYGKLSINNSIIEGNYAKASAAYSDLSLSSTPTTSQLMIHNSIIGRNAGQEVPVECYPGDNQFNYLSRTSINFDLIAQFAAFDEALHIYKLLAPSPAIMLGDAQYLQALDIHTDQLGTIRKFTNNKCYAGSVELIGELVNPGGGPVESYKHFMIYGQSLSTGHQAYPVISTENVPGNYMIGEQLWINYGNVNMTSFNPLVGTISNEFKSQSNIRSRSAGTIAECPLFGAVNHIQLKQPGEKILATSCGTSGMTIEELSKESQTRTFYNDFTTSIKYASQIARQTYSTISCPAIFWMQGEWNYQGYGSGLTLGSKPTADKNAYKALMITLKNNMQADIQSRYGQTEAPLFIEYQCGAQYIKGKEQNIGMAQLEASNEYPDIICAGSVYPMTDRGGHLDPNGYRWYGEMLGKVYYQTKVLNQRFRPLQPKEISRTEKSNQVKVKFLVSHLPLVLDDLILAKVKDYGFEVYLNSVKQTLTSVSVSEDCVYLTCSAPLNGNVEVAYAGINTGGSGNLRDSDPYQSFFKYIDLDKKDENGVYLFPRDASETTLRPDYQPKDASGNVIYDQPYPLYNFSVSFYYKLPSGQQTYTVPNLETNPSGVTTVKTEKAINAFQSGSSLILDLKSVSAGALRVTLFDTSGLIVRVFTEEATAYSKKEFPLSVLQKGIYLAKIELGDERETVKLVL